MNGAFALAVDGDYVSASFDEFRDDEFRFDDHEMNVNYLVRNWTQRIDDEGADSDVGNESAVHYIDVHPFGAGGINGANFLAEFGEISG